MAEVGTFCVTDRGRTREKPGTMKEWLFSKLLIPFNESADGPVCENKSDESTDDGQTSNVPTIVISRGSNKSINDPINSPVFRAKQHLIRLRSEGGSIKRSHPLEYSSSVGVSASCGKIDIARPRHALDESDLPISEPIKTRDQSSQRKESLGFPAMSPILRFSLKKNMSASSSVSSQLTVDNEKVQSVDGGKVGHSVSYPLVDQFDSFRQASEGPVRSLSQHVPHRRLDIRRTSSCGAPVSRAYNRGRGRFVKTNSRTGQDQFTGKKSDSEILKRSRNVSSVESGKSTVSLTQSSSLGLGLTKHGKSSKIPETRKLSLINNEELSHVYARRHSSLLRLFSSCSRNLNKTDTDSTTSDTTPADVYTGKVDEDGAISPKITRHYFIGSLMRSGSQFDNFRSTFESDLRDVPTVYGQVKLTFQYITCKQQLQVTVLRGCNLASENTGHLGIFSTICILPRKRQKQRGKSRHNTHDPLFHDLYCFNLTLDEVLEGQLKIKFYNKPGFFSWSIPVGECMVDLYNYDLTAVSVIWKNLTRSKGQKSQQEEFDFTLIGKTDKYTGKNSPGRILTACSCIHVPDPDDDVFTSGVHCDANT